MAVELLDRPTVSPTRSQPPPRRLRSGRLRDLLRRPPVVPLPVGDATAVHDLLMEARAVVQRGWVQDAWYVVRDRRGRPRPIGPCHVGRLDHTEVSAACLVGAVLHAASLRGAAGERGTTGAALDQLWHALRTPAGAGAPAHSPAERAGRARDLSRWNDAPGRRRDDVLALFDAAVLRAASPPPATSLSPGRQTT
jgi:hypothetical protein